MNEMVTRLMQFGFTNYEAKAYLALLQKHPAIGYEVSKIARIPTAKIYETLARLRKKGAVYCSASQPTLYLPVDPQALMGRLEREFNERLESLGCLLSAVTPAPDVDIIWNLTGCRAVVDKMGDAIQHAGDEVLASLWPEDCAGLMALLLSAHRRGVHVITGIFGPADPSCPFAVSLETCGASSLRRLGKRLNTVVVDSKEVVMGELGDENDSAGVWATTPCLVLAAKEYIKHDIWGKALIDEVGPQRFDAMCCGNSILSYLIQTR